MVSEGLGKQEKQHNWSQFVRKVAGHDHNMQL